MQQGVLRSGAATTSPANPRRWRRINTSTSTEDSTMPQLVEPTTPDAQREIIRNSLRRNRRRSRNFTARRSSGFSGLSDSPELGRFACNDGMSSRSVRWRLVTCFSHRLPDHRATTGRRSAARTAITLRGGECDDGCHRCDCRRGERGMTVARCHLTASRSSSRCCGGGIRGADLVRYGAIRLPTSIGECNNPSILFSFRYLASEGSE